MLDTVSQTAPLVYKFLESLRNDNGCLHQICIELPKKKLLGFETRAYFMRITYEFLSGHSWNEDVKLACAAIELELCSMYFTNRIFDDKGGSEILARPHEQVIAAMITRDLAELALGEACSSLGNQVRDGVVRGFVEMNQKIYIGQFYEVSNNIFSKVGESDLAELYRLYELRNQVNYPFYEWIASIAAALAGIDDDRKSAVVKFGYNFGMMQQIVNDIADFVPPEMNAGTDTKLPEDAYSDIKHGKLTLPTIEALTERPCRGRELLVSVLRGEVVNHEELINITKFMVQSGAIRRAQDAARAHASQALTQLSGLSVDARWPFECMCHIAYSNRYYRELRNFDYTKQGPKE